MGIVEKSRIDDILKNVSNWIVDVYSSVEKMTVNEVYFLIVMLAQYLYAKYAVAGTLDGTSYKVYPQTIESAISAEKKTSWSSYAYNIVLLRNDICHNFGSRDMYSLFKQINSNRKQIKLFIKYLGIIDGASISDGNIDGKKDGVEPVSISDTDPLGDMLKGASLG